MKRIMQCPKCRRYTMKEKCDADNEKTINPKPAKYSIDDRTGEYRRTAKREGLEKRGLL